jgi:hypothetical protein
MKKMNIENRYVKDRRVHVERRLGTTPKGYIVQERRTINDRRSYHDRRLEPWSWQFEAPTKVDLSLKP